jgi:hypothetical protein
MSSEVTTVWGIHASQVAQSTANQDECFAYPGHRQAHQSVPGYCHLSGQWTTASENRESYHAFALGGHILLDPQIGLRSTSIDINNPG